MAGSMMLVTVMAVVSLLSWILAMAGLSAVTDEITDDYRLSLEWFILFVQLLVIIALPVLAYTDYLRKLSNAMIAYLAILSTLWLIFANNAYEAVRDDSFVSDARWNTLIAGAVFLFCCNFVYILLLSLHHSSEDDSAESAHPPKHAPAVPVSKSATSGQADQSRAKTPPSPITERAEPHSPAPATEQV